MHQDFSFWEFETYSRDWDICIIGSGITGLSTGISLLQRNPNLHILIVDRWFVPLGASTRNAGFSCFGSPSEIVEDIAQMGEDVTLSLISKRWNGLLKLHQRIDPVYTQYETNGGYELYRPDEFERIVDQLPYLNQLLEEITSHKNIYNVVQVPQGIQGFSNAVYNALEGQLHPGYLLEDLRRKYLFLGGHLQTGFQVDKIEDHGDHVSLLNRLSFPVKTRKVIVTTNAFAAQLIPELDVQGARNHVLVTNPIPHLSWKGCFHYDRGFYYFRNIGDRILLGGARNKDAVNENTVEFGSNPVILDTLQRFLFDHLANKDHCRIDYQWSGIIGVGKVKLPIISVVSPRVLVGVRLSGMGIALASLIGDELSELALQQ